MWYHLQLLQHKGKVCNRSEDLIPISTINKSSISNYMKIRAPINGDTSIDHPSSTAKFYNSLHKRMIVFSSTFLLDKNKECVIFFEKNTPIIWINKKSRTQSEKRILCLSILVQVISSVAHSFRGLRCLAVNDTHTIGRWECWLTA